LRYIPLAALALLLLQVSPVLGDGPAQASLLCEVSSLAPGKPVTLGLRFKLKKGWHIYWKNPGDSGQAPSVKWDLPKGFRAEEILWPVPKRLPASGMLDYGYEGEVLLPVPLEVPKHLKPGQEVSLSAKVKWLVCHEVCLPGEATLKLQVPVKDRRMGPAMKTRALFQKARDSFPLPLPEDRRLTAIRGPKDLKLSLEGAPAPKTAFFLPAQPGLVENAAPQDLKALENGFELTLKRSAEASQDVQTLEGVLVLKDEKGATSAYGISTKLYSLR
jgi:DsbC/DsbD-like thiol-disulfide interchange protein